MKTLPVEAEFFPCGQTDRHNEAKNHFSRSCGRAKKKQVGKRALSLEGPEEKYGCRKGHGISECLMNIPRARNAKCTNVHKDMYSAMSDRPSTRAVQTGNSAPTGQTGCHPPGRSHFSPLLRQVSNLLSLVIYSNCRREQNVCTSVIMWHVDSYYKQGDMTSSIKTILK